MKNIKFYTLALALAAGAFSLTSYAAHGHGGTPPTEVTEAQNAWLVKAKAEYPLDTCVVSGEKLETTDMGAPIDYIYKEDGMPDRLVRFCCPKCVKDFKKDPAKYLKKIDAARGGMSDDMGHTGHQH